MRVDCVGDALVDEGFPFLFGGTFIEGTNYLERHKMAKNFPSFSEGLSLRVRSCGGIEIPKSYFPSFSEGLSLRVLHFHMIRCQQRTFPFLFGGTFIEGPRSSRRTHQSSLFPFLFGGTFIEGSPHREACVVRWRCHFPSFSEGLSLRVMAVCPNVLPNEVISLPFRRDFH